MDSNFAQVVHHKEYLQIKIKEALQKIIDIRVFAKQYDLLNSQEYLDFEDALNQISVADPNK